ncbi:hypothetical protein FG93_01161 [Bosea sp. LC85]|nr:hypothetical protein FG93_01161 [Bosea sp. LC85]
MAVTDCPNADVIACGRRSAATVSLAALLELSRLIDGID